MSDNQRESAESLLTEGVNLNELGVVTAGTDTK